MVKKVPQRQCIGCAENKNKSDMMRVIKTADGEICLDLSGKKNGRGAYLCKNMECLKKARKTKALEKSFKMAIPTSVYDSLEKEYASGDK